MMSDLENPTPGQSAQIITYHINLRSVFSN
jgi:hypothetical protein